MSTRSSRAGTPRGSLTADGWPEISRISTGPQADAAILTSVGGASMSVGALRNLLLAEEEQQEQHQQQTSFFPGRSSTPRGRGRGRGEQQQRSLSPMGVSPPTPAPANVEGQGFAEVVQQLARISDRLDRLEGRESSVPSPAAPEVEEIVRRSVAAALTAKEPSSQLDLSSALLRSQEEMSSAMLAASAAEAARAARREEKEARREEKELEREQQCVHTHMLSAPSIFGLGEDQLKGLCKLSFARARARAMSPLLAKLSQLVESLAEDRESFLGEVRRAFLREGRFVSPEQLHFFSSLQSQEHWSSSEAKRVRARTLIAAFALVPLRDFGPAAYHQVVVAASYGPGEGPTTAREQDDREAGKVQFLHGPLPVHGQGF